MTPWGLGGGIGSGDCCDCYQWSARALNYYHLWCLEASQWTGPKQRLRSEVPSRSDDLDRFLFVCFLLCLGFFFQHTHLVLEDTPRFITRPPTTTTTLSNCVINWRAVSRLQLCNNHIQLPRIRGDIREAAPQTSFPRGDQTKKKETSVRGCL